MPTALYSQLQQVALTGTRRLPLSKLTPHSSSPNATEHALHCALTQADTPETLRLLRAVAVAAVMERATWQGTPASAEMAEHALAPIPAEPPFSPEIVQAMGQILDAEKAIGYGSRTLIVALLTRLCEAKQSLPPELLLQALSLGSHRPGFSTDKELRPYLSAVLGARGYWLARQNPTWEWVAWLPSDENNETIWQQGNLEQRHALLLREREHNPDAARERFAASFDHISSKERIFLIEVLKTKLSMNDEPFLESLLQRTDRAVGKNLRKKIVDLLDKLPQSHHSQRIMAIMRGLLQQDEKGIWQIEPPDDFDPAWLRDGISPEGDSTYNLETGRRGACLRELTAHTPLFFWSQTTGMSVEELVKWSNKTQWRRELQQGWFSILKQGSSADNQWIEIYFHNRKLSYDHREILPLLTQAQREAIWCKDINNSELDLGNEIRFCQQQTVNFLSPEFSQRVIGRIELLAKQLKFRISNMLAKLGLGDTKAEINEFPRALDYLNKVVTYLDDSVLPRVDALLHTYQDQWSQHWPNEYQSVCQKLALRHTLHACQVAIAARAQTTLSSI